VYSHKHLLKTQKAFSKLYDADTKLRTIVKKGSKTK